MKKSMYFLFCKKYIRDLKKVEKNCKERLEKQISEEIAHSLLLKTFLPNCCVPLFYYRDFKVYKLRVSACGKGKSGGLRIIFGYNESKNLILLVSLYRKSQKENMIKSEILKEIVKCLVSFWKDSPH